jgi:hypothetical protein
VGAFDNDQEKTGAQPAGHAPLDRGPVRNDHLQSGAATEPEPEIPGDVGLRYLQQNAGNAAVTSLLEPAQVSFGSGVHEPGGSLEQSVESDPDLDPGLGGRGSFWPGAGPAGTGPAPLAGDGASLGAGQELAASTEQGLFDTRHQVLHLRDRTAGVADGPATRLAGPAGEQPGGLTATPPATATEIPDVNGF